MLENVEIYAYHGISAQEREVGNEFLVTLKVEVDLGKASYSDVLNDTISYASLYNIVVEEMIMPSNLLEYVAGRIIRRIKREMYQVEGIMLKISKKNPPLGGQLEAASVLFID